ncbi:MAG TPA: SET domain-containing protein [Candidatus Acidoferrum sp.]|nr:SET domain-containing protein [Candidatus Acidoferrum sp.]
MIVPKYEIRPAPYSEGKGVFLLEPVKKGQVLVAPDAINKVYNQKQREALVPGSPEDDACVRWFESYHTVSTDWPDDCYVNHSFTPTGLWHLGFVFATRDLKIGDEVTADYRFLVNDNEVMPFKDAETGMEIVGYTWTENLRISTQLLLSLLND